MFFKSTFIALAALSTLGLSLPQISNVTSDAAAEAAAVAAAAAGIYTTCKKPGQFALTINDGPWKYGSGIADIIEEHGGKGTFFVNGNNFGCIYDFADELRARFNAGHTIASNTWGHADLTTLTTPQIHKQLDLIDNALKEILGVTPRLFRIPYASYNDDILAILKSRGYKLIGWSFDAREANGATPAQAIANYKQVATTYPKSQIGLTYETHQEILEKTIPVVVPYLVKKGYKLVTVDECIGVSPYLTVGKPGKKNADWTCVGKPAPGQGN